jgi:thiamine pyrophosphate-dependent acetolactate synthase large subunit-like protein
VVTHEPSAGFAADAYARLRGLGCGASGPHWLPLVPAASTW